MLFVRRCLGGVRAASLLLSRCTLHCPSDLAHPRRPCPAPPAAVHALRQSASFSHSASPSSTSASSATASPPPPLLTPTLTPLPHKNPSFRDLKVHAFFISFLEKSKHLKNPTLIQTAAIPWLIRRPWNNTAFPDIVMEEMTGQGKSLAYLLPVLSNVDNYLDALQAVIVVPSRELAVQVSKLVYELLSHGSSTRRANPVRHQTFVGDVNPYMLSVVEKMKHSSEEGELGNELPTETQIPHVLIGTPQTLHTLLVQKQSFPTNELKYIVFDEVDATLGEQGKHDNVVKGLINLRSKEVVEPPIEAPKKQPRKQEFAFGSEETVVKAKPWNPARTQVCFVSASITASTHQFAVKNLVNPQLITPASVPTECARKRRLLSQKLPVGIFHYFIYTSRPYEREVLLRKLLTVVGAQWTDYRARLLSPKAQRVKDKKAEKATPSLIMGGLDGVGGFGSIGIQTTAVFFNSAQRMTPHINPLSAQFRLGVLSEQSSRSERREALRLGFTDVLLSTDLLARGMDLKCCTHIVNYEVPLNAVQYQHRAGRVGRLGALYARQGTVITLIDPENVEEKEHYFSILKSLGVKRVNRVYISNNKLIESQERINIQTSGDVNITVKATPVPGVEYIEEEKVHEGDHELATTPELPAVLPGSKPVKPTTPSSTSPTSSPSSSPIPSPPSSSARSADIFVSSSSLQSERARIDALKAANLPITPHQAVPKFVAKNNEEEDFIVIDDDDVAAEGENDDWDVEEFEGMDEFEDDDVFNTPSAASSSSSSSSTRSSPKSSSPSSPSSPASPSSPSSLRSSRSSAASPSSSPPPASPRPIPIESVTTYAATFDLPPPSATQAEQHQQQQAVRSPSFERNFKKLKQFARAGPVQEETQPAQTNEPTGRQSRRTKPSKLVVEAEEEEEAWWRTPTAVKSKQ